MKYTTTLIIVALLCGCSSAPKKEVVTKVVTKEVKIPVYVECPVPPELEDPELIIKQLSDQDINEPGKVVQSYKATIKQLQNHIIELNILLDAYR